MFYCRLPHSHLDMSRLLKSTSLVDSVLRKVVEDFTARQYFDPLQEALDTPAGDEIRLAVTEQAQSNRTLDFILVERNDFLTKVIKGQGTDSKGLARLEWQLSVPFYLSFVSLCYLSLGINSLFFFQSSEVGTIISYYFGFLGLSNFRFLNITYVVLSLFLFSFFLPHLILHKRSLDRLKLKRATRSCLKVTWSVLGLACWLVAFTLLIGLEFGLSTTFTVYFLPGYQLALPAFPPSSSVYFVVSAIWAFFGILFATRHNALIQRRNELLTSLDRKA